MSIVDKNRTNDMWHAAKCLALSIYQEASGPGHARLTHRSAEAHAAHPPPWTFALFSLTPTQCYDLFLADTLCCKFRLYSTCTYYKSRLLRFSPTWNLPPSSPVPSFSISFLNSIYTSPLPRVCSPGDPLKQDRARLFYYRDLFS